MKFANSNKVNLGIALALFGILFFSLMSSVEGMEGAKKTTDKKEPKKEGMKEGIVKKTKG